MNYGVPYMGSKNKIVAWVVRNLPAGRTLYDIFAGGCAVTHRAMVEHKYDRFVVNDINDYASLAFDDPLGVIYCDPPYKGTAGYNGTGFDHEAFYDWCQRQTLPLVISEYDMPEGFVCIAETKHRSRLSGTANNEVTERLFAPKGNPAERRIRKYEQLTLFNYASI